MDATQKTKIIEKLTGLGLEIVAIVVFTAFLSVALRKVLPERTYSFKRMWFFICFPLLVCRLSFLFSTQLPGYVDSTLNGFLPDQRKNFYPITDQARELHKKLWISDLHTDTLMWASRGDMNERQTLGHVDVERLLEGNVALQGFTIVTSSPMFLNFEINPRPNLFTDTITYKSLIEGWGVPATMSLARRVLFQVSQLKRFVASSNGRLHLITNKPEFEHYLEIRKANNITAGFLGIEGLHSLEGNIANLQVFVDAGVRMMSPTHFFDTELGGSAHGEKKGGLSEFGESVIKHLEDHKVFIDVAHASEAVIDDVIKLATRPIICSHTGVRGVCDNQRNLQDRHVIGIAQSGGVIGVGFFRPAICTDNLIDSLVETIKYIRGLVGVEHIALGSDYDGSVYVPFDISELIQITSALLHHGFTEHEIELIMGGNVRNLMRSYLPDQ